MVEVYQCMAWIAINVIYDTYLVFNILGGPKRI